MHTKTICIIEDNVSIKSLLALLFKKSGAQTVEFENGKNAMTWLANNTPDAIICDILLPDLNGSDILQRVRLLPNGASIPVIVVTGFANTHDREKYMKQGFNGYIPKPINVSTFVSEVESIIGK